VKFVGGGETFGSYVLGIMRLKSTTTFSYILEINLKISINSLKYLRSTTLGYKDIEIRKSEFVAKTLFLFHIFWK